MIRKISVKIEKLEKIEKSFFKKVKIKKRNKINEEILNLFRKKEKIWK